MLGVQESPCLEIAGSNRAMGVLTRHLIFCSPVAGFRWRNAEVCIACLLKSPIPDVLTWIDSAEMQMAPLSPKAKS